MKIVIEEISIGEEERIRKESGDLESLQLSIEEVGLINPILVDENIKLIAGYRRLTACKNLGWREIEATVMEIKGDPMLMLDIEVAENLFRKDFTPEELLAVEQKRQEIIESLRKKSIFERFWLWLKGLFASHPVETADPIEETETVEAAISEETAEPDPMPEPEETQSESRGEDNSVCSVKKETENGEINIFSTTADKMVDPYRK